MRWSNGSVTRPHVSSPFGPRKSPGNGGSTYHRGSDFTGFSQVHAVASGRVVVTGTPSGWSGGGRQVWIQHDGFYSKSMHLASTAVSNGQWVNEGEIIGVMGRTGTATGVHLHLEITLGTVHYSNSGQVDPVAFLSARVSAGVDWPARTRYGAAHVVEGQKGLIALGYELGSAGADGKDGPATQGAVRDLQSKNGLTVDGILGPNTLAKIRELLSADVGRNATDRPTADVQRLVGANPDGVYGPDTTAKVKTWQKANGLTPDGVWGPLSDAKGFPAVVDEGLDVDGILGHDTIVALQLSLGFRGADVDGKLGPKSIAALQRVLEVPDDGEMGPVTAKALQRALGVAVDGAIGEETIKALQTLLNAGGKLIPVEGEPEVDPIKPARPAAATYPDAAWWDHSVNSSPRLDKVQYFVVHHAAATSSVEALRSRFMRPNDRNVSPNWLIGADGSVSEIVPPDDFRAWTSGQFDHMAVTVETQNTSGDPAWGISPQSHEAIARLVAWAADRYEFPIDRAHVIGHREVPAAATACPGPSMNLAWIVARALELSKPPAPEPQIPDEVSVPTEVVDEIHERWTALGQSLAKLGA